MMMPREGDTGNGNRTFVSCVSNCLGLSAFHVSNKKHEIRSVGGSEYENTTVEFCPIGICLPFDTCRLSLVGWLVRASTAFECRRRFQPVPDSPDHRSGGDNRHAVLCGAVRSCESHLFTGGDVR